MHFYHPFQCIKYLKGPASEGHGFLVGAAGAKLYIFDAGTGIQLSTWSFGNETEPPQSSVGARSFLHIEDKDAEGSGPPGKRRKLSPAPSVEDQDTRESLESEGNFAIGKNQAIGMSWSTISILAISPTGEHIVAMTAADKCIRVFEADGNGRLSQLSERQVVKILNAFYWPEGKFVY